MDENSTFKHAQTLLKMFGNGRVYLACVIGWRLVRNLSWVCPEMHCILASCLENRGYLDTLNNIVLACFPFENWGALFWQTSKPNPPSFL